MAFFLFIFSSGFYCCYNSGRQRVCSIEQHQFSSALKFRYCKKAKFFQDNLHLVLKSCTPCCISLDSCCSGVETRVIIKILIHPCYPIKVDWLIFIGRKKSKWPTQKTENFNSPKSHFFLRQFQRLDFGLGTIQVLPRQRGGWVGSENGNFCWFTVLFMLK